MNSRLFVSVITVAVATVFSLGLSSCASSSAKNETTAEGTPQSKDNTYEAKIDRYSAGDREYSGFYNTFEYRATIMNTPIREATLQRQATYFQWDNDKQATERERNNQEMSSRTEIFVSFFTPDRRNDNLTDMKSIWKVYLDAGGQRYEGKAKRSKMLLAELQALFPHHTRWNTAYILEFPVPTTAIETQESVLTITGPLGTRAVTFRAL